MFTPQTASEQPHEITVYAMQSAFASQETSAAVKEHGLVLASTSWNTDGPQLAGKASGISADPASPLSPASIAPLSLGPPRPLLDPEPPPLDPPALDPPPLPLAPDEPVPLDPPLLPETLLSPPPGDVSVVPPQPVASSTSAAASRAGMALIDRPPSLESVRTSP
jgi:hypothetical protein